MLNGKVYHTIIILLIFIFNWSCKKQLQKEESTVTISVVNPITGEGYSGVQYEIKEYIETEDGQILGSSDDETEESPIATGETDVNGNASVQFYKKKNLEYSYRIFFDYSAMDVAGGDYEIVKGASFANLYSDLRKHYFNFEIVPIVKFVTHKKNYNCQGVNDLMKHRIKFLYTGSGDWTSWQYGFQGCYESLSDVKTHPMEVFVTELEVTREDGTIENIIDTSRIGINEIDTIKYYY